MGDAERMQRIIQWATILKIEINSIEQGMKQQPPQTVALKLVPMALTDAKRLTDLILGEVNEQAS